MSFPARASGLERLLPVAIVAAAAVLFASELLTAFEFTPPGAEPQADQSNADRHNYAQAVLAAFAVIAMFAAISSGSKPAAAAVAACGVLALLIFLLLDLPDANNIGTFDDPRESFFDAEAVPQAGFWLELLGALGLALTGSALATLTSEQIAALGPGGGRKPKLRADRRPESPAKPQPPEPEQAAEPARARARSKSG